MSGVDTRMSFPLFAERREIKHAPTRAVGLLVGLAAATPGVAAQLPGLPLRPWHILVLAALTVSLFFHFRKRSREPLKFHKIEIAVVATTSAMLVAEYINSTDLNYAADYVSATHYVFWLAIYYAVRLVVFNEVDAKRILVWFTLPAFPSVAIGVAQVLGVTAVQMAIVKLSPGGLGFISRLESGFLLRATGLVQHWTLFGAYLCTVVAAAGALLVLARRRGIGNSTYAWLTIGVASLGVLTTFTLAPIITAIVIVLLCAWRARSLKRMVAIALLLSGLSAMAFGGLVSVRIEQQFAQKGVASSSGAWGLVPSTLLYRYRIWTTETIPMVAERPLTGWGAGVYDGARGSEDAGRIYPSRLFWASPESQWLAIMMNYGFLGLAGFSILLCYMATVVHRAHRSGMQWIASPSSALFLLMFLSAFTAPVLTSYGFPFGMWMLLGVMAAMSRAKPHSSSSLISHGANRNRARIAETRH